MIAKARSISHGSAMTNYATKHNRTDMVLTRKLGELIPLAERAIASLKAAGRDDLEEDIEDAEFLIEDYKKRFGF